MFENVYEFTGDPVSSGPAIYNFSVSASPFSFMVSRSGAAPGDAPLFNTAGQRLIFKVKNASALPLTPQGYHSALQKTALATC